MAVRIFFASGNCRKAWLDGRKEFRGCGVFAAVMANFQNVGAKRVLVSVCQNIVLGIFFGVPWQEESAFAEGQSKNQRVIIFGGWRNLFRSYLRPEKLKMGAEQVELVAAQFMDNIHSAGFSQGFQLLLRNGIHFAANPQRFYFEIVKDSGQSAEMILVCVGQRNDIDLFKPTRPKIRRNHVFAGIWPARFRGSIGLDERSSAIDQYGMAAGGNQKKGITLADVQGGEFQRSMAPTRSEGKNRNECGTAQYAGKGKSPRVRRRASRWPQGDGKNDREKKEGADQPEWRRGNAIAQPWQLSDPVDGVEE